MSNPAFEIESDDNNNNNTKSSPITEYKSKYKNVVNNDSNK